MIKIGEIIEHNGVKLECVELDTSFKELSCDGCYFKDDPPICSDIFKCMYKFRADNKDVIFREVKE